MKNRDIALIAITAGYLVGSWATVVWTFLMAYDSPGKELVLHIDRSGEANIELAFLIASFVILPYAAFRLIKWIKNEQRP